MRLAWAGEEAQPACHIALTSTLHYQYPSFLDRSAGGVRVLPMAKVTS
jgi:hypothetical protein